MDKSQQAKPRPSPAAKPHPWIAAGARATALSLGLFSLANLTIGLHQPGFDANIWWIDLRPLPAWAANLFLIMSGVVLLMQGAMRVPPAFHRRIVYGVLLILGGTAAWNAISFFRQLSAGDIHSAFPVPFSAIVLVTCLVLFFTLRHSGAVLQRRHRISGAIIALLIATAFPVAQMWCFGWTDYRRRGDVAVVFGAGIFVDGTPSLALSDRVLTACKLYRDELVTHLLFSGGPGPGRIHEVDAMKRLAVQQGGVPASAILVDPLGVDTQSTVSNTCRIVNKEGFSRVLAVSHFYHLPRIKLTFQRAGWNVYTVPATESRTLLKLPYFVAREIAAFWYYYARPLLA